MNQLAVKKRAEVAAFIVLAGDIAGRAGQPFADRAADCRQALQAIANQTVGGGLEGEARELFDSKTAKTVQKLTAMMELYVGDEWDNPTEVLEWCSFYAGAGAAHCAIAGHLAGADGDSIAAEQLKQLESDFRHLLDIVIGRLAQ